MVIYGIQFQTAEGWKLYHMDTEQRMPFLTTFKPLAEHKMRCILTDLPMRVWQFNLDPLDE